MIRLSQPLETANGPVSELHMRRPDMGDYHNAGTYDTDDVSRGVALVASLCDLSPEELLSLSVPDFKKVIAEFNRLTCGAFDPSKAVKN